MGERAQELINWGAQNLRRRGIPEARIDAEALLAFSLGVSRELLVADLGFEIGKQAVDRFKSFVERRAQSEPLAYITGVKEFWSLEFEVDRSALIPRPETEFVVEEALAIGRLALSRPARILDIGTGCGNIAISLAKELDDCIVVAIDVSEQALALAKRNALRLGVASRLDFQRLNLFDLPTRYKADFDMAVSNPPYVPAAEIEALPCSVKNFEPMVALNGGGDGLHFTRGILSSCPKVLKPGGFLIIEIGFGQKEALENCIMDLGAFSILKVVKDYAGIERVLVAQLKW